MKNCIVYLVKNHPDYIDQLNDSLVSVASNLEPSFESKVDLILFVDPDFPRGSVNYPGKLQLRFIEVDFSQVPNGLSKYQVPQYFPNPNAPSEIGFSIGYRHMCRFYSGSIYSIPEIHEYEYYLRLDTDSQILSSVNYDLFVRVKNKGAVYGFIREGIQFDNPRVCFGLHDESIAWARKQGGMRRLRAYLIKRNKMYYTNFELGRVDFFTSENWSSYFQHLDQSNGFMLARWGDAVVKYFGVNVLTGRQQRLALKGFRYGHGAIYENEARVVQSYMRRIRNLIRIMRGL